MWISVYLIKWTIYITMNVIIIMIIKLYKGITERVIKITESNKANQVRFLEKLLILMND